MKIAGARVENKRLVPGLAIFMLGGAPTAHEVLPRKRTLSKSTCPANLRVGGLFNALLFFAFGLGSATIGGVEGANSDGD